jgi:transglutaminase-like putative cysteine protease
VSRVNEDSLDRIHTIDRIKSLVPIIFLILSILLIPSKVFDEPFVSPLVSPSAEGISVDATQPAGEFLDSTDVVDWFHQDVRAQAWLLAAGVSDPVEIARRCFEWVRDEVQHSVDFERCEVTCTASEVLAARTGFCFAKSHLLAALLRANGIAAGFCYQRLSIDGTGAPFSLHGLNAVWLPEHGWYRVDARGKKAGGDQPAVDAQFTPPVERLAFPIQHAGEADLPEIWPEPLAVVIAALRSHATVAQLADHLPDLAVVGAAVT